jgi:hypothetical protein
MSRFIRIGKRILNVDHVLYVDLDSGSQEKTARIGFNAPSSSDGGRLVLSFDREEAEALRRFFSNEAEDLEKLEPSMITPEIQAALDAAYDSMEKEDEDQKPAVPKEG